MAVWLALVFFESSFAERRDAKCTDKVLRVEFVSHSCNNPSRNGFVAGSTQGTSVLMVVQLTVGFTLVLVVGPGTKPVLAFIADKALDMPLSLEGSDNVVDNSFVAATTLGSEHLVVIALAVGFTFKHMVLSSTSGERFLAVNTHKAIRMPSLLQRRDTSINNGSVAMRAPRSELSVVIFLTVRHVVSFKELPHSQLHPTSNAHEMFRVPCFTQRGNHLANDNFIAS